ncbi:hypothetical protein AGMMS49975_20680 [Clostridia bacterium]|nr:hypothetical protein AGMMS49975_20680 [Clostridia bacterium]
MYHIIENPVMMTAEEIDKEYDGRWVYLVKCEFAPGDELLKGMPVVVADNIFEGVEDGVYLPYKNKAIYGRTRSHPLIDTFGLIPTVKWVAT